MNIEKNNEPVVAAEGCLDPEFDVIIEDLLPPVNEFKRFIKVFFKRKIVIFGFVMIILFLAVAAFGDFIAPYGVNEQDLDNVLAVPSASHILGTDALGRDMLSRTIFGTRVALAVGVSTVLISAAIGTLFGLIAGYAQGIVQTIIMRCTDAMMALPSLILVLLLAAVLKSGVIGVVIAMSVMLFPGYIRLICGQVLSVKQNDYVLAERSMGAKKARIMLRHILPNCLSPLIVQMTMMIGIAILAEASLSFLGLGIHPPTPAWGSLCNDGQKYLMMRPLLSIAPGFAIMLLVFSCNMVGDGLRDALDPKLRGTN